MDEIKVTNVWTKIHRLVAYYVLAVLLPDSGKFRGSPSVDVKKIIGGDTF
jgi:hypothetical protein